MRRPRAARRIAPPASRHSVALSVTHGFHAGAQLSLVAPLYTVGSSTESDVVLRDAGIAPVHARLRRKGSQIEIEAVGGHVTLATGEIIREGQGRRCKLPLAISVGDAHIRLVNPERPPNRWSVSNRPLLVAGSVLFAVFAVSVAANGFSFAEPDSGKNLSAQVDKPITVAFAGEAGQSVLDDSSPTAQHRRGGTPTQAAPRAIRHQHIGGSAITWTARGLGHDRQ